MAPRRRGWRRALDAQRTVIFVSLVVPSNKIRGGDVLARQIGDVAPEVVIASSYRREGGPCQLGLARFSSKPGRSSCILRRCIGSQQY
jgi:hypothetical protein